MARQSMDIAKILMAAALMALTASACSRIDTEEETLQERPVTFSAFTEKRTKGEITTTQELAAAGGFNVWGFSTNSSSPDWANAKTIFNQQEVTSSTGDYVDTDSTTWTYTPVKYWNKSSVYCFYAAAPASKTGSTWQYSVSNGRKDSVMITVTGLKSSKTSNAVDIMIARRGVKNVNGSNPGNIDFTFYHIMAKVKVKLKLGDGFNADSLVVNKLEMTGWDNDDGTFTQRHDTVSSGTEIDEWEFASTSSTMGTAYFIGETAQDKKVLLKKDSIEEYTCLDTYIMIPQQFTQDANNYNLTPLKFNAKFTIYYSDHTSDEFNIPAQVPTAGIWATDSETTYTITLAPVAIKIDAESTAWDTGDNKTIEIN